MYQRLYPSQVSPAQPRLVVLAELLDSLELWFHQLVPDFYLLSCHNQKIRTILINMLQTELNGFRMDFS
jgi:hypothetical protein